MSSIAEVPPEVTAILQGGMPQALGIHVLSIGPDVVTAQMDVRPIHCNTNGNVNGGAIMAFADTLGAIGAAMRRPPEYRGGTIESKTNFLVPAAGPVLLATSVPLHAGRTTSVWQTSIKNHAGALVAVVTQTQIALPNRQS